MGLCVVRCNNSYKLRLCLGNMAESTDVSIVLLTKGFALARAEEILALEHNWTEIGDEPWNLDNLMSKLPGKWELSHVALKDEDIIGYQIGSLKDGGVFLNKIVVDQERRVNGTGRKLLKAFLSKSLEKGIERIRFKVRVDNAAVKFYGKLGFIPEKEIDHSRPDKIASHVYDTKIKDVIENV